MISGFIRGHTFLMGMWRGMRNRVERREKFCFETGPTKSWLPPWSVLEYT